MLALYCDTGHYDAGSARPHHRAGQGKHNIYTPAAQIYMYTYIYKAPVRYVMVLIVMCDFSHDVRSGVCAAICLSGVLQRNWRMEYIRPYAGRRIGA